MINSYLKNSANKKYIDFKDGEPSNTIRNYCDSQMDDSSAKLGRMVTSCCPSGKCEILYLISLFSSKLIFRLFIDCEDYFGLLSII